MAEPLCREIWRLGLRAYRLWLNEVRIHYAEKEEGAAGSAIGRLSNDSYRQSDDLALDVETGLRRRSSAVMHAASTNHTYFFRDRRP